MTFKEIFWEKDKENDVFVEILGESHFDCLWVYSPNSDSSRCQQAWGVFKDWHAPGFNESYVFMQTPEEITEYLESYGTEPQVIQEVTKLFNMLRMGIA